jgi:SAM-dependent methyltransferase
MFRYDEHRFYVAGLRLGLSNLTRNRFALGLKKTVGKIAQPVNSFTRFPEYYFINTEIKKRVSQAHNALPAILDVGSPKLLGLILAEALEVDLRLTDISTLNLDEYEIMWRSVRTRAKGKATFEQQDARSLSYPNDSFDVAYSMSVLEHVQGENGDVRAMSELIRVTKPGGLIMVTVPFGPKYVEQQRCGLQDAVVRTSRKQRYFFQRIYASYESTDRFLRNDNLQQVSVITVWRTNLLLARLFNSIGDYPRAFLGFLNPVMSFLVNRHSPGLTSSNTVYEDVFRPSDIYSDLVITARKRAD